MITVDPGPASTIESHVNPPGGAVNRIAEVMRSQDTRRRR